MTHWDRLVASEPWVPWAWARRNSRTSTADYCRNWLGSVRNKLTPGGIEMVGASDGLFGRYCRENCEARKSAGKLLRIICVTTVPMGLLPGDADRAINPIAR